MLKTTSVSDLRNDLAKVLKEVGRGPVVVMSRSRPAAVLVHPDTFEALIENAETLADIVEGRLALAKFLEDPSRAKEAEEVFARLGF